MRSLKFMFLSFVLSLFVFIALARASIFGEENAILSKILLEDVQHTLKLKDIIGFAGEQLQTLNEKYGYDKWLNKGLDEVKSYGFLEELSLDDYVLGTLQSDVDQLGFHFGDNDYQMDNLNEWIEQAWGTAPELANAQTQYPGSINEWNFQVEHDLPGVYAGSYSLRSAAGRESAELAYKRALWNMRFTQKNRLKYEDLLLDAHNANPGEASRLMAVSSGLQTIQLSQINDTQSTLLKLNAERQLTSNLEETIKTTNVKNGFQGLRGLFRAAPTFGK